MPTPELNATVIAQAVATALAQAGVGPAPVPTPAPGATPDPEPVPTPSPADRSEAAATATAAAVINAQAAALSAAVQIAFQEIVLNPDGDREAIIANASAQANADPNAVATAIAEILEYNVTPTFNATEIYIATANAGAEATAIAAAGNRYAESATATAAFVNSLQGTQDARDAIQATFDASLPDENSDPATATAWAIATQPKRYDHWNDDEWLADPKPWWRPSNPYNCDPPANSNSPWTAAGLPDLGGQDSLSLIRYFGNGSYVRYGLMGFEGCTFMTDHPERTHVDQPVDPSYYSLGDLVISVDIARVPVGAPEWDNDNGVRIGMSMAQAVNLLNTHVAAYFRKISEGKLRMTFVAGHDFQASGRGTPQEVEDQWLGLIGIVGCRPDEPDRPGCQGGMPGALNRIIMYDVGVFTGGSAWNGYTELGLGSVQHAVMPVLVHEIGHAWMLWPHSYTELPWRPDSGGYQRPNFYSNRHDFMSQLTPARPSGWHQDLPSTLAINRYAAGWIAPNDVALHLSDQGTYTLSRPRESGDQFLVIHSGRPGAFTTLEVLDERNAAYQETWDAIYDAASPGQKRPLRYEGVLVSRYDQTTGTGVNARVGPALYNTANPNHERDVGYGQDDYSVIGHGESRSIGGGVTVSVTRNSDGSYNVSVSGGKIASFEPWCVPVWFTGEYDSGCLMEGLGF